MRLGEGKLKKWWMDCTTSDMKEKRVCVMADKTQWMKKTCCANNK